MNIQIRLTRKKEREMIDPKKYYDFRCTTFECDVHTFVVSGEKITTNTSGEHIAICPECKHETTSFISERIEPRKFRLFCPECGLFDVYSTDPNVTFSFIRESNNIHINIITRCRCGRKISASIKATPEDIQYFNNSIEELFKNK